MSLAPSPPPLSTPWTTATLLQIRTSKMQPMQGLTTTTGIYKQPQHGRIFCGPEGFENDEHDLTFHGGPDKAVHQYFPGHYPNWQSEFPDHDGNFEVGGFGENLVAKGTGGGGEMNERNVCIGDVVGIGGEVVLQVSLPRQPCFKLNHRFGLKGFAPNTWRLSRTGWDYRVLKTGWVSPGDEITLAERKHPAWTIERIQEYLHRNTGDLEKLEELAAVPEFGRECKRGFAWLIERIHEKAKAKTKVKEPEVFTSWTVVEKKKETTRITKFVLQCDAHDDEGAGIPPGGFVRLRLPNGLLRSYSIVHGTRNRLTLGIARDAQSRGGSTYLHDHINLASKLDVGAINPSIPMVESASNHVFIAGGIGITAFLGHCNLMKSINYSFTLHLAVRSEADIPFQGALEGLGPRVRVYRGDQGERLDARDILGGRSWNSMTYVCGPERLVSAVQAAAEALSLADEEIYYEAFGARVGGDPFAVSVKGQGEKKVEVGETESLLEALRGGGWSVDSSCEVGNCGTCKVRVCGGSTGEVEHRGSGLTKGEKAEGELLSCVSRGRMGAHLVLEW
ncbi:MOSC domain-containing protein [Amylocarpus encephaloides]|uniref:MOSC domain-containing protein n=1 Tax=Amylocarpus encephaloides TaxID=45428 RepID=A0A9P7YKB7_9HELO|nr:MOSC domain-containing protein [Amylocarpus encephaloides]